MSIIKLLGFISFVIGLAILIANLINPITDAHSFVMTAYSFPAGIFAGDFITSLRNKR
mgnify:CR=1 FL=1